MNISLLILSCLLFKIGTQDQQYKYEIWLNQNERRTKDTPKAKEQEWFSGIFMEATRRKSEKN